MLDDRRFPSLSFWQFQLIGWSCFYALTMVAAAPYLKEPHVFLANSIWVLVLFAVSWLLRPACSYSLKKHRPWFIHEIHALAFALTLSALAVVLVDVVIIRDQPNDWSGLPLDFVQNSIVLFLWCNVYYAATQWQEMSQQREQMLRAESQLREAKLNALRLQLNPHFLFNSLNAVSTLVLDHDSERATRMLSRIGTLLRRTLEEESIAEIPLAQELEFTNQYLEVEQIRLGERLRVTTDVSPDTLNAVVPVMLLQPLVENAVIHGIASQVSGGDLLIRSVIVDSRLKVIVKNSGVRRNGGSVNEHGIGLKNCIERLQTIYGTDYRLELNWPDEGGCEVKLDLPFATVRN